MHVFIDESGSFVVPQQTGKHSLSFCAALVVPTQKLANLTIEFVRLTRPWRDKDGEVKGKNLNEQQIDAVLQLYQKYDCMLEAVGIDLGLHTLSAVILYKNVTVSNLEKILEITLENDAGKKFEHYINTLKTAKAPLFVHSTLMEQLVENILKKYILIFSFKSPEELSDIQWYFDAKDLKLTAMENTWNNIFLGSIEYRSIQSPMFTVSQGDYSFLPKGILEYHPTVPEKFKPYLDVDTVNNPCWTFDVTALLANRRFADSRRIVGLQMVDVAASALRRAALGNLAHEGWRRISSLLVCLQVPDPVLSQAVPMIGLGSDWDDAHPKGAHEDVVLRMRREARRFGPRQGAPKA